MYREPKGQEKGAQIDEDNCVKNTAKEEYGYDTTNNSHLRSIPIDAFLSIPTDCAFATTTNDRGDRPDENR